MKNDYIENKIWDGVMAKYNVYIRYIPMYIYGQTIKTK